MIYLGIDPGVAGALALIDGSGARVWDTPVVVDGTRRNYLVASMAALLDQAEGLDAVAAVEQGIAMPRQAAPSTFKAGRGVGLWEGLLAGRGIAYELVLSRRWKHEMGLGRGAPKTASRVLAQQLFPAIADRLERAKDDGRAEALLIAEWRRRQG